IQGLGVLISLRIVHLRDDFRTAEFLTADGAGIADKAGEADIDLSALPARKSAFEKVFLAAALKTLTLVSNRWPAERLQLGKTSSVPSLLRQFRLAQGTTEPRFRAVISRFMT
ncbi:MAG: hypothetical protein ACREF9_18165, partial [Opitutaceae bacterium]